MQNRTYEGQHIRIVPTEKRYSDEVMKTIKENIGKTGNIPQVDSVLIKSQPHSEGTFNKTEDIYYKVILDGTNEIVIIPGIALELY